MFRLIGWISDAMNSVLPLGSGSSYEAAQLTTAAVPTDDSGTLSDLGMTWPSTLDVIRATFA